ncbi:MAG: HsdR family type I site-specific deoxyribonuclease [Bacteroides sp.]|nr:HsdR family type I site-specific deoxyribonuclease [Muribaculum sp.]MCM1372163.1 HsdR family type I site-specific deoxyribonuclease [Bacteroides sp.]
MPRNGKYYESEYEKAVVELLHAEGWQYTHGEQVKKRRVDEAIIEDDVRNFIKLRYADSDLTEDEIDAIIARLRNTGGSTDYEAIFNTVELYRDGFDFSYPDRRKSAFHFDYIDFNPQKWDNNIFRVVNQFEMRQGRETRIPDVVLFINGIPVVVIELKNPTDANATIRDAHTQITVRYRRDIMNLLKYCSLAIVSDGSNSRMGNVFADYEFFYAWKKVKNADKPVQGVEQLRSMIKGALTPERIIDIIRDYVYFPDKEYAMQKADEGKEIEVVCRYPQFFATRILRDNIMLHLRSNGGDGKGGTYFGATGCGKTYTMLFLTRQLALRCKDKVGSPTVLIIVDREDLEDQTGKLFIHSTKFLSNGAVRVFDSRDDLGKELRNRQQGGVYITTIQKFSSETGLLSERSNIICISDEAHRTQNNTGSKLRIVDRKKENDENLSHASNEKLGAFITYGFAKYLRDALPNATYVGFTGTPVDETTHVFGSIVDSYSMRQARKDGITVDISYEPRLIHVNLSTEKCEEIEMYYKQCEEDGAKADDVDKSKSVMSSLNEVLGNSDRLDRMARDIAAYYDKRVEDQPELSQKAMVACSDRKIAFKLYKAIIALRPEWGKKVKAVDESQYTEEELCNMEAVPFVNIVATRDKDDATEMYNILGDKQHRKDLDRLFKDENSNFRIAIVVDMWITGFDVPSLNMLFNDKPLQKHTLIQTISRVNRNFFNVVLDDDGNRISGDVKKNGIIIDYLGIHSNLQQAMKKYGGEEPGEVGDVNIAFVAFCNELKVLRQITHGFDFSDFFGKNALARLMCLQNAVEFLLMEDAKGTLYEGDVKPSTAFKSHIKRLKAAYNICNPAGVLSDEEVAWAQLLMGVYSYLIKITDSKHDVESMNRHVEQMVKEAISCSSVETIFDMKGEIDIYGDDFLKELEDVKMPCTKFELLVKLLRSTIKEYKKTNKTRAEHFYKLLQATIEEYHNRDKLTYVNQVTGQAINSTVSMVEERINTLTEQLKSLFGELQTDKMRFKKLGISFQEKAFYDILVEVRDNAQPPFEYSDERCIELAKKIKQLVDDSSLYADWLNNSKVRDRLANQLTKLFWKNGYPPEWDEVVFDKVLEQVENFKENSYQVPRNYDYSSNDYASSMVAEP